MKEKSKHIRKIVPVKTDLDPSLFVSLIEQCTEIFNIHSKWAYKNKSWNKKEAQKELYSYVRQQFPDVPSALIQTMRDSALECAKRNRCNGKTPTKKRTSSIRFDLRTMTLRGRQLTVSTLDKRQKTIINVPEYFEHIVDGWKFTGGTLSLRKDGCVWINLGFKTERPEEIGDRVVGIDKGLCNISVLSDGTVFNSKNIRKQKRKYFNLRKRLQAKGTRSAKRLLRKFSGREKRFSLNVNHKITKEIINLPYDVFVVEDLSGIRDRNRGKRMNGQLHSWAFYQFDQFLTYKAEAAGKKVVKVNPSYTSQTCSCCGFVDRENRNKSKFKCKDCGFTSHSDLNASINIKNKYILSTERSERQVAVNQPYVSNISSDTNHTP